MPVVAVAPLLPTARVSPLDHAPTLFDSPNSDLANPGAHQAVSAPELSDPAASAGFLADATREIRIVAGSPSVGGPDMGDGDSLATSRPQVEIFPVRIWDVDPVLNARLVDLYFAAPREPRPDLFMPPADAGADHNPPPRMAELPVDGRLRDPAVLTGLNMLADVAAPLLSGAAPAVTAPDSTAVRPATQAENTHGTALLAPRMIPSSSEPDDDVAVAPVQDAGSDAEVVDAPATSHPHGTLTVAAEVLAALAPSATPIAGLLPLDVQTLARNADRFFTRLSAVGKTWSDPRLTLEIALWSAALAAGAYELAHVRGKRTACPSFADDGEVSSLIVPVDGEHS